MKNVWCCFRDGKFWFVAESKLAIEQELKSGLGLKESCRLGAGLFEFEPQNGLWHIRTLTAHYTAFESVLCREQS